MASELPGPSGSREVAPARPEETSRPRSLVLGPQSRAPGAAGGQGFRAQEGAGAGPRGAERSPAAEGPSGRREGGCARSTGPGTPGGRLVPPGATQSRLSARGLPTPPSRAPPPTRMSPASIPRATKVTHSLLTAGHPASQCPLRHPFTSDGSLSTRGPPSCGTPSALSRPELRLAHLHDGGSLLSQRQNPRAPPWGALRVTAALPPRPRPSAATLTWSCWWPG